MSKLYKILFLVPAMLIAFSAYAQSGGDSVVTNGYQVFYYSNGSKSSEGIMRDGKPDGYWKTYYENGILKTEGNRKNFELDSVWKFYDRHGKLTLSITYKNGKKKGPRTTYLKNKTVVEYFENNVKNGITKEYYPDGKLWKTIPYKKGLEDGISVTYAEDGRIIALTRFKKGFLKSREFINRYDENGNKIGLWKEFWPGDDYITKTEISYRNGIIDGYAKYYDKEGNLSKIEKYVNGVLMVDPPELAEFEIKTDYYPDGSIKTIGSYKDGVAEGMRRDYSKDGKIIAGYILHKGRIIGKGIIDENGLKQGPWKEFYMSGRLMAEGNYKDNIKTGLWKYYFENGNLEQTGAYDAKGRAKGKWTWYYPDKTLRRVENFYEGISQGDMVEYAADSTVMVQGEYVDGTKEGFWIENVNGYRDEGEYLEDMREGVWKSYYPNGNLYFEGKFIDDVPDGKHVWYYENGKVKKSGTYLMGLRDGEWRYFDEDGKLFLTVEYNKGIEVKYDSKKVEPEISPSEMTE